MTDSYVTAVAADLPSGATHQQQQQQPNLPCIQHIQAVLSFLTRSRHNEINGFDPISKVSKIPLRKDLQLQMSALQALGYLQIVILPCISQIIDEHFVEATSPAAVQFIKQLRVYQAEKGAVLVKQGDLVNRDVFILLKGVAGEFKKTGGLVVNAKIKEDSIIKDISKLAKGQEAAFITHDNLRVMLVDKGCEFSRLEIGEAFGVDTLFGNAARTSTLAAISDAVLIAFSKADFQRVLASLEDERKRVRGILKQALNVDFSLFNQTMVQSIISCFHQEQLNLKDQILFKQNQFGDKVYIIQGSCEIIMKYLIKQDAAPGLTSDLSGEFVVHSHQNGVFFVGDEMIFHTQKKYSYTLRIPQKTTIIYASTAAQVKERFHTSLIDSMKAQFLEKVVFYRQKYDKCMQRLLTDEAAKLAAAAAATTAKRRSTQFSSSARKSMSLHNNNTSMRVDSVASMLINDKLQLVSQQQSKTSIQSNNSSHNNIFQQLQNKMNEGKQASRILEQEILNSNCFITISNAIPSATATYNPPATQRMSTVRTITQDSNSDTLLDDFFSPLTYHRTNNNRTLSARNLQQQTSKQDQLLSQQRLMSMTMSLSSRVNHKLVTTGKSDTESGDDQEQSPGKFRQIHSTRSSAQDAKRQQKLREVQQQQQQCGSTVKDGSEVKQRTLNEQMTEQSRTVSPLTNSITSRKVSKSYSLSDSKNHYKHIQLQSNDINSGFSPSTPTIKQTVGDISLWSSPLKTSNMTMENESMRDYAQSITFPENIEREVKRLRVRSSLVTPVTSKFIEVKQSGLTNQNAERSRITTSNKKQKRIHDTSFSVRSSFIGNSTVKRAFIVKKASNVE